MERAPSLFHAMRALLFSRCDAREHGSARRARQEVLAATRERARAATRDANSASDQPSARARARNKCGVCREASKHARARDKRRSRVVCGCSLCGALRARSRWLGCGSAHARAHLVGGQVLGGAQSSFERVFMERATNITSLPQHPRGATQPARARARGARAWSARDERHARRWRTHRR